MLSIILLVMLPTILLVMLPIILHVILPTILHNILLAILLEILHTTQHGIVPYIVPGILLTILLVLGSDGSGERILCKNYLPSECQHLLNRSEGPQNTNPQTVDATHGNAPNLTYMRYALCGRSGSCQSQNAISCHGS